MLANIRIVGEIGEENYVDFCTKLDAIEDIPEKRRPKMITVEIVSEGGSPYLALAFISRMRLSPVKFRTVANGRVASAATLILAAGDWRQMTSEAWVMVHEDSDELSGTVTQMEKDLKHLRGMEDQWNTLLSGFSKGKSTKRYFDQLHAEGDVHLTPEECLDIGLIDEVI